MSFMFVDETPKPKHDHAFSQMEATDHYVQGPVYNECVRGRTPVL